MKKILLSLFISLAVLGMTAKVKAQCAGANVTIENFAVHPNSNSVDYSFDWTYVKGNASIQIAFLCNGTELATKDCMPFLKDSAAGPHHVSGTQIISCNGLLRVEIRIYASTACGGTYCSVFREVSQIALPVKFNSFTAARNHSNVVLKWETAFEQNNKGFAIERNIRGVWEQVSFVASQSADGNSNNALAYLFVDLNDVKGITQYRIRQVDFDAKSSFSEIRAVRGEGQTGKTVVFPNPSLDGRVSVVFEDATVTRDVSLSDMSGRILKQWKGVSNNNIQIDNLIPGMYSLKIVVPETGVQSVEKIIVSKR